MATRPFLSYLSVAVCLVAGSSVTLAQTTTATLQGTVTDATGAVLPDVTVQLEGAAGTHASMTDGAGFYRLPALVPGTYTVVASRSGFRPRRVDDVLLPVDRAMTLDLQLELGAVVQVVVRAETPVVDRSRSSLSSIISPQTIDVTPLNGRNYLDLIRLTPGVVVNDRAGAAALSDRDTRGAILGERAGNVSFLIDGLWNNDDVRGGVLQGLTQDTVQEFEVVATGYKAEFGRGSGGVVNVITKAGSNQLSGTSLFFVRNDAWDASNVADQEAPELTRYNPGFTIGGPVTENRSWYFASYEHVTEDRESLFPPNIPDVLTKDEDFSQKPEVRHHRLFGKYTRRLTPSHDLRIVGGWEDVEHRHRLQSAQSLPSASDDTEQLSFLSSATVTSQLSARTLVEGLFGVQGQSLDSNTDRGESRSYSVLFLEDGRSFDFGPPLGSVRTLDQHYYTLRGSLSSFVGTRHTFRGGLEYTHTAVDGENEPGIQHVLLTTRSSFARYGRASFQIPQGIGFLTPEDQRTHLRSNGLVFFVQDDWRLRDRLTLNLGARYEFDSIFDDVNNIAPRIGMAWAADDRTVVRASWGRFYDRYRLGIAHVVPELGGFNGRTVAEVNFPRLLADAVPVGPGALARLSAATRDPFILHRLFGIPFDAIVTRDNVTALTGFTPDRFLTALRTFLASTGIPFLPVDFSPHTGYLRQDLSAPLEDRIRAAHPFSTPYNQTFSVGLERSLWNGWVAGAAFGHRSIEKILGLRLTNLSPRAREIGAPVTVDGGPLLRTYGPWYDGEYDAAILSLDVPFNGRYRLGASYTFADGTDNVLNPNLALGIATQGAGAVPTDNLDLEFDRGPSDLAVRHSFVASGSAELPWTFTVSGVAHATSGVYFTAAEASDRPIDYDGDGIQSRRPRGTRRNQFRGPATFNLDLRVARSFAWGAGTRATLLIELFNLTNARNPRLIDNAFLRGAPGPTFGDTLVPLPGREAQIGVRFTF